MFGLHLCSGFDQSLPMLYYWGNPREVVEEQKSMRGKRDIIDPSHSRTFAPLALLQFFLLLAALPPFCALCLVVLLLPMRVSIRLPARQHVHVAPCSAGPEIHHAFSRALQDRCSTSSTGYVGSSAAVVVLDASRRSISPRLPCFGSRLTYVNCFDFWLLLLLRQFRGLLVPFR